MTTSATSETGSPAEWADVARHKYEHYRKLCDAYEAGGENAPALVAIDVHERHLAEMVPHLVDAIDSLCAEMDAVRAGLGQIFLDKPGMHSPRLPGNDIGEAFHAGVAFEGDAAVDAEYGATR